MKQKLEKALENGFMFLSEKQLPSGEFRTKVWSSRSNSLIHASYVKTVSVTALVLHSLKHVDKFLDTERVNQKAISFLLDEMESNGLWRFYGKKSHIHFDIDDTCATLAALKEMKVEMDYESIASRLLEYRNIEKIFETWILDVDPPFDKKDNNVDWVVNANALFFYSLLKQNIFELEQYLIKIVEEGTFKQRSPYYRSPFCFIYFFTRAYADGSNPRVSPAIVDVKNYLLNFKRPNFSDNPLENAFGTVGLLNCNVSSIELEMPIEKLLNLQRKDGSWPNGVFCEDFYNCLLYGSEELTSAIALEAISKYLTKTA